MNTVYKSIETKQKPKSVNNDSSKKIISNTKKTLKTTTTNSSKIKNNSKISAPFEKNYTSFNISYTKKPSKLIKNISKTENVIPEIIEKKMKNFDFDLIFCSENNTNLYLSDYVSAKNPKLRNQIDVNSIITIADQLKLDFETFEEINYLYIPALDIETYYIAKHFDECLKFIENGLQKGNVLVHCAAGVSRSATIIIAFLMMKNKWNFEKTFQFVKEKRKLIDPNEGFIKQLKNYEKKIDL